MKVRKILVLVLALLLVFAIGAFAQEAGEPGEGEPGAEGAPGASGTGASEQAAPQAFQTSWDTKGWFHWEYQYIEAKTYLSPIENVTAAAQNQLHLNLTYNISKKLSLTVKLFWGAYWGAGRASGGYWPGMAKTSNLSINQDSDGVGTWPSTSIYTAAGGNVAQADIDTISVKSVYMTWKIGGIFGKLSVGRMPASWAMDGAVLGLYSGADRLNWQLKLKFAGYLALPGIIYELRGDMSTGRGDELHQIIPSFIMIGPGKTLEQLWFAASIFIPEGRFESSVGNEEPKWYILNVYTKLRFGANLEVNLQANFTFGSEAYDSAAEEWSQDVMSLIFIANAKINLGIVTLRPEFALITAKPSQNDSKWFALVGNIFESSDIGPKILAHDMGSYYVGVGFSGVAGAGYFFATLKADFNFGMLTVWLEPGIAMVVGKTSIFGTYLADQDGGGKFLGFEIDLGVDLKLAQGLMFGVEFNYLMPSGMIGEDSTIGAAKSYVYAFAFKLDMEF